LHLLQVPSNRILSLSNDSLLIRLYHRQSRITEVKQTLVGWLTVCIAGLKALAPYAAIELLLPGGSLMALGLWLYQRRNNRKGGVANRGVA
jgi:hypothetical protein